MSAHKCGKCSTPVDDGVNGTVYEPAPWQPSGAPPEVCCWGCEAEAELAAEDRRQEDQIEAALRAGRMDLV